MILFHTSHTEQLLVYHMCIPTGLQTLGRALLPEKYILYYSQLLPKNPGHTLVIQTVFGTYWDYCWYLIILYTASIWFLKIYFSSLYKLYARYLAYPADSLSSDFEHC